MRTSTKRGTLTLTLKGKWTLEHLARVLLAVDQLYFVLALNITGRPAQLSLEGLSYNSPLKLRVGGQGETLKAMADVLGRGGAKALEKMLPRDDTRESLDEGLRTLRKAVTAVSTVRAA